MPQPAVSERAALGTILGDGLAQPTPSQARASLPTEAQHPHSDRKDQKALAGCYGNSHKLDQYSAQGAGCVTVVESGGGDSCSGAGAPSSTVAPALPLHRSVLTCPRPRCSLGGRRAWGTLQRTCFLPFLQARGQAKAHSAALGCRSTAANSPTGGGRSMIPQHSSSHSPSWGAEGATHHPELLLVSVDGA